MYNMANRCWLLVQAHLRLKLRRITISAAALDFPQSDYRPWF